MTMKPLDGRGLPPTSAERLIRQEIEAAGRITFARFMELALYAPAAGYYETRAATDFSRDYVTSPELHPAFGVLLCGQLEEMWRRLGRPGEFWLIEAGPGTGTFAADVLATVAEVFPGFGAALRLGLLERSAALREIQRQNLRRWMDRVQWLDPGRVEPVGPGCIFANELLDAFPVHRIAMSAHGVEEIYVDLSQ